MLHIVERCRYAKYVDLFTVKTPDAVVIWNGNKLPNKTVVIAAKSLKIKVFYFENGLLPGTTSLDPQGINYAASFTREPNFYLNFDPLDKHSFVTPELIPREQHKKRAEFGAVKLPEHYIFVPFQVPHDTQMASFSPWIKSMEMLYDSVIQAVEALGDPDLKVVFKEHPSWHVHYTSLYNKNNLGVFANCNETQELIQNAKAVVTVNSTVGLESLLLSKKVITVGQSCYNLDKLVLHASEQAELLQCLVDIQQGWELDLHLRDKFFSYLKHVYSIEGRWQDCSKVHAKSVEDRLLEVDAFSQSQKENNGQYSNLPMAARAHK
ncbi:capsular biosynthesis protein [Pseudoalteromonas shioyasakiensis]|uniref:capsular polysaccharide export protein, LipB/KpsS family n=1 Tax=Pseudoalteromonas shioyasakiensis TaxID=1190813 RepID=UPI0021192C0E|nr:capsular biosynthesis protein [Pseudoalteromonas shioyasakiensis]MCQ8879960.1 capsular biosynthesis protein [Pseudoalteromonas shioyasakiensis]